MADIVMACIVMADTVMACIVMADTFMACIVMADTFMACIVVADTFMACKVMVVGACNTNTVMASCSCCLYSYVQCNPGPIYVVMASYSYGLIQLWPFVVMAFYSYVQCNPGPMRLCAISSWPTFNISHYGICSRRFFSRFFLFRRMPTANAEHR